MTRRSIRDPLGPSFDGAGEARGQSFDALAGDIRGRAAQLSAVGDLLTASVASRPPNNEATNGRGPGGHVFASDDARQSDDPASPGTSDHLAGAGGGANAGLAAETWQRRQIELLQRIDENLRRLRELQESARPAQIAFTEPV